MDINNKARIHWACRRGMRELDISIMPFFEYEYDQLNDTDKALFIRLLESDDPDLFNWLMNHGAPQDSELQRMVTLIQTRNKDRGPVAMCRPYFLAHPVTFPADTWRTDPADPDFTLAGRLRADLAGVADAGGV